MKTINGTVTTAAGFSAVGGHIGLKKEKKDLMILCSIKDMVAAGCFTTNIVKAAPVLWDMEIIKSRSKVKGVVVNSGNANACTGQQGLDDTKEMASTFGNLIGAKPEEVLVSSTGVIGVNLPMNIVKKGIESLFPSIGNTEEHGISAAEAILTTDTYTKNFAVEIELSGKKITLGGMAKGSGMIHPDMATMLSFVTTDCNINYEMLNKALKETVYDTYNMISVDGDTSTNDTVIVLANGMAENPEITTENDDYETFKQALAFINKQLAVSVVRDGEGASKLMEVTVYGAKTKADAVKISKSVTSSSLFKAALFGADANWGRVLCAMGYSGGVFDPFGVSIVFKSKQGEILLMENGNPIVFDEEQAKTVLNEKEILININLKEGNATATAWGCDLTYDYVKINGDYRS